MFYEDSVLESPDAEATIDTKEPGVSRNDLLLLT